MIDFLTGPRGIIIRYLIAGGTGAVVDLSFVYVLTEYVGFDKHTTSVPVAFLIALLVSYTMQKYWTFTDNKSVRTHSQAMAFFAVQFFNFFLNSLLVYILTEKADIWYMASQFITGALLAISSFLIYRNFIFPKKDGTANVE